MISLIFVLFDVGISSVFKLGIGVSLLIAGSRCVGQLALVVATIYMACFPYLLCVCPAFIQHPSRLPFVVSLVMLNFLGTFETGTSTRCVLFDKLTFFCSYKQIFQTVSLYDTSKLL